MRVKRLEIQGFKSFKDKTVIHFDHGITGIVGPNGCGKSNIVDAFFWVMGEQSYKHMRGSGSEDLIFNGSSKYSPLGLAEATLVMETDVPDTENAPSGATAKDIPLHLRTKEVSVTRRLYRSGEGEYFMNGVPARLKDIQELFMDTGVGAKGYSVIEQGQIGKIVNAKPEDRRLLIEEAAGIAKYKARKKESLRKMEATQSNLSRLTDVIQEIERNVASLDRQAQKARQYTKYKDELLDKELTWGRRKSQVFKQKLEALRKQKEAFEQELVGLRAELQVAENAIETDRVDQVTDSKRAEELQSQIQKISDELARERSALDLSRRRQGDLASQLASLEGEQTELQAAIVQGAQVLDEQQSQAELADQSHQAAAGAARALDEEVREYRTAAETARKALDQSKREMMDGVTRASDLTSRAAALASKRESAESHLTRIGQQIEALAKKLATARLEAEKALQSATEMTAKREELQSARKERAAQVQVLEQALRQADQSRDLAGRELMKTRSRMHSLEELVQAHEGLGDGPKAALDWASGNGKTGKIMALSDVIQITTGYETAVECWMDQQLDHLITQDPEVALQVFEALKSEKSGRVGIQLDMKSVSSPELGSVAAVKKVLVEYGFEFVGCLSEFVSTNGGANEVSSSVLEKLSAGAMVVQEFQDFSSVSKKWAAMLERLQGWSVVSMDGTVLRSDGFLCGGSVSEEATGAVGLIRRKQAISELQNQVAREEETLRTQERACEQAKQQLDTERTRLQEVQTELQRLEVQAAGLERDVHQGRRAVKESESQVELAESELAETRESAERAEAERLKTEAQIANLMGSRSDLESRIAALEMESVAKDAVFREHEGKLQSLRIEEAQLRERATSLKRELEAGRALIADRQRRLAEVERTLQRAAHEKDQFTGGDSGLSQKIEDLTRSLSQFREDLSGVKDRLEQGSAKVNHALERIKELHKTGDHKTSEANQLALEIEKLSAEATHLLQNLEEKYGPGCLERAVTSPIQEEMNEPVVTAEMTAEEELLLGEEVERLRERIRRLGEVNVSAIEEYEEVKKRYDYLLTERTDLQHSIENLQDAIEHINKTSEDRFRKAFDAIANRFERLFPIIFGGGQAKLSLVYPEGSNDILDAGVDILAQPPGKKIVNIGLLSGGEKALTAVSLIFAIFMVKPSPFCVLDEVDAPLDDANIGKFNALLREMASKSQFILITHNKKTMELNDTLYGVTMEEPGVSKMVSIEMR